MSAQVLQQALLPFYSTKQQGTGLGLPLCREIVEAHSGQLSIRNGVDAGLEVVMRVPQGRSE
jgi:signal transduction histidine kinase